jgi:hypothetical protein
MGIVILSSDFGFLLNLCRMFNKTFMKIRPIRMTYVLQIAFVLVEQCITGRVTHDIFSCLAHIGTNKHFRNV